MLHLAPELTASGSGRLKRKTVIIFQLLNMLVFIKRWAPEPARVLPEYRLMLWRRLLGAFLKDILSRRWSLPQVAGVIFVLRHWRSVYRVRTADLDDTYPQLQRRILAELG